MWLFGIARHVLENAERGQRRRWRLANTLREASAGTTAGAPADAGLEVRDAIARLEPELAELIRLVHWDGFTISEAAELFDVPASTARSRYHKAKLQLKDALSTEVRERNRTSIS